jgi:hypothetical protein
MRTGGAVSFTTSPQTSAADPGGATARSPEAYPVPVVPFSFTVTGSGLTLADFEVASSGGSGSGFFAGHEASPTQSGYSGSSSPVPEPSSLALLGSGLIAMGTIVRRKLVR